MTASSIINACLHAVAYAMAYTFVVTLIWTWLMAPRRRARVRDEHADLDRIARSDFRIIGNPELERRIQQHMGRKGARASAQRGNFR